MPSEVKTSHRRNFWNLPTTARWVACLEEGGKWEGWNTSTADQQEAQKELDRYQKEIGPRVVLVKVDQGYRLQELERQSQEIGRVYAEMAISQARTAIDRLGNALPAKEATIAAYLVNAVDRAREERVSPEMAVRAFLETIHRPTAPVPEVVVFHSWDEANEWIQKNKGRF